VPYFNDKDTEEVVENDGLCQVPRPLQFEAESTKRKRNRHRVINCYARHMHVVEPSCHSTTKILWCSFTKSLHYILKLIHFRRHKLTRRGIYHPVLRLLENIIWTIISISCTAADVTSWDPRLIWTNVTILYILHILTTSRTELRHIILVYIALFFILRLLVSTRASPSRYTTGCLQMLYNCKYPVVYLDGEAHFKTVNNFKAVNKYININANRIPYKLTI
jgi:hypothetical protein